MLERLYYNCANPLEILDSGLILTSKIYSGVSMSSSRQVYSHGPFKIEFKQAPWFRQFIEVMYWEFPPKPLRRVGEAEAEPAPYYVKDHKWRTYTEAEFQYECSRYRELVGDRYFGRVFKYGLTFATELEWFSIDPVQFSLLEVDQVTFMTNAPNIVSARRVRQVKKELIERYRGLYKEEAIHDPYYCG